MICHDAQPPISRNLATGDGVLLRPGAHLPVCGVAALAGRQSYVPRCGSTEHSFSTRHLWFCKGCKKQFTVKVGTMFEDSALGMDLWMIAVWMFAICKNGLNSYELGRALGITQKSAWFLLHRVRLAMHNKDFVKLGGHGQEVEVRITYQELTGKGTDTVHQG